MKVQIRHEEEYAIICRFCGGTEFVKTRFVLGRQTLASVQEAPRVHFHPKEFGAGCDCKAGYAWVSGPWVIVDHLGSMLAHGNYTLENGKPQVDPAIDGPDWDIHRIKALGEEEIAASGEPSRKWVIVVDAPLLVVLVATNGARSELIDFEDVRYSKLTDQEIRDKFQAALLALRTVENR